jgi:hypothetical protein
LERLEAKIYDCNRPKEKMKRENGEKKEVWKIEKRKNKFQKVKNLRKDKIFLKYEEEYNCSEVRWNFCGKY